jgi:hypothetical protein
MSWPPRETIPAAILKVRRAAVCVVCGNEKEAGRWFDRTCYFTLRPDLRTSLWAIHQHSDDELRDTFLQAVDHLIKHGQRFVPRQKMSVEAQQIIEETGFSEALTEYLYGAKGAVSVSRVRQSNEFRELDIPEGTKTEPL